MRIEILTEIARIREKEQGDTRLAFEAWSAAFAEDAVRGGPARGPRPAGRRHRRIRPPGRGLRGAAVGQHRSGAGADAGLEGGGPVRGAAGQLQPGGRLPAADRQRARAGGRGAGPARGAADQAGPLEGPGGGARPGGGGHPRQHPAGDPAGVAGRAAPGQARATARARSRRSGTRSCACPTTPRRWPPCATCCRTWTCAGRWWTSWSRWPRAGATTPSWLRCTRCGWRSRAAGPSGRCGGGGWPRSPRASSNDHPRALEALGSSLKEDPSVPDTAEALERVALQLRPAGGRGPGDGGGAGTAERRRAGGAEPAGGRALREGGHRPRTPTTPRPSGCTAGCSTRRRRTAAPSRRWRACTGRAARTTSWPRCWSSAGPWRWTPERRRGVLRRGGAPSRAPGRRPRRPPRPGRRSGRTTRATPRRWKSWPACWSSRGTPPSWSRCWRTAPGSAIAREERASLFFRIGELRRGPLQDADGAAAAFREVLDISPADRSALAALASLEEARGDFSALEEVLLRRLSVAEGAERVDALLALARNAEERLTDVDRAISYLHQILETDPRNRGRQRPADAAARAERALVRPHRAARAAGHASRGSKDLEAELASRLAIADIWSRRLGDRQSAARGGGQGAGPQGRPRRRPAGPGRAARAGRALGRGGRGAGEGGQGRRRRPAQKAEVHFRRSRVLAAQGAGRDRDRGGPAGGARRRPRAPRGGQARPRSGRASRATRPGWCKLLEQRLQADPRRRAEGAAARRSRRSTAGRWPRPTGRCRP